MPGKNKLLAFLNLQLDFIRFHDQPHQILALYKEIIEYIAGKNACSVLYFPNNHTSIADAKLKTLFEDFILKKDQLSLYFTVKDLPDSIVSRLRLNHSDFEFFIPVKTTFPAYQLKAITFIPWLSMNTLQCIISLSNILELKIQNTLLFQDWRDSEFESSSKSSFHCTLHEIRNKLTAPMTYIQMMLKEKPESNIAELGNLALVQIEEINAYSGHYLNLFSKLSQESEKFEYASLDHAVSLAAAPLSLLLTKEKIILDKPNVSGIYLPLPASLLRDIIFNLLKNAVSALKRSTKKNKKVSITLINQKSTFGFSMTDNGIGLSAKQLKCIARPFNTFQTNSRGQTDGHGLGLSIVKRFIESYSGKITFSSRQNEFFKINILFPKKLKTEH